MKRVSFSFVAAVRVRDHAVTVEVTDWEPVILSRLGRRTDDGPPGWTAGFAKPAAARLRSWVRCYPG